MDHLSYELAIELTVSCQTAIILSKGREIKCECEEIVEFLEEQMENDDRKPMKDP